MKDFIEASVETAGIMLVALVIAMSFMTGIIACCPILEAVDTETDTDTDCVEHEDAHEDACGLIYQMFVEGSIAQGRFEDVQAYLDDYCDEVPR